MEEVLKHCLRHMKNCIKLKLTVDHQSSFLADCMSI